MKIEKITQTEFKINGIESITPRALVKLKSFLSILDDISYIMNKESIIFTFDKNDVNYIGKGLIEIKEYFDDQNIEIVLDKETQNILIEQEKNIKDRKETKNILKTIKATNFKETEDYNNFCKVCDNFLNITLRQYQYEAAYLLSTGKGGFDFSVPGAGKTIISYTAYKYLKEKKIVDCLFVVGPGSAYNAWFDEYITCFNVEPDFENLAEDSTDASRWYLESSLNNHKEITFINIEKLRSVTKEIIDFFKQHKALLIIDEGHKIKNPNAEVTKAALQITKFAESRIILTGTPMPNGYEDLFSLLKVYAPYDDILPYPYSKLKSLSKGDDTSSEVEKLKESIAPYYSRISKKYLYETKELEKPNITYINCSMDESQDLLYEKLNDFYAITKDNIDEHFLTTLKRAILIRKMQISANPSLIKDSLLNTISELKENCTEEQHIEDVDLEELESIDQELMIQFKQSEIAKIVRCYENFSLISNKNKEAIKLVKTIVGKGQKVIVWDIFVKNMAVLLQLLQNELGNCIELINGTVSKQERQESIKRFKKGNSMVLLANPATLAESISLHKVCQNAIYINRNFNASQFIQSKDRIHRINMPKGTTANYFFLINENTVDDIIDKRLKKKESRMLAILDNEELCVGGENFDDAVAMSIEDIETSFAK